MSLAPASVECGRLCWCSACADDSELFVLLLFLYFGLCVVVSAVFWVSCVCSLVLWRFAVRVHVCMCACECACAFACPCTCERETVFELVQVIACSLDSFPSRPCLA